MELGIFFFLPAIVKNPLPILICLFAGSDITSAAEVQSRGEVLAWCGAGEQYGTWCVEQSGWGAASPGQRHRRDRMLPYCPGAGGQLSHLTLHHHSPHPLRHSEQRTSVRKSCMNHSFNRTQTPNPETSLLWNAFPTPLNFLSVLRCGSAEK